MATKTDKTAADIRETHGRMHRPIAWAARVPEFKDLCAYWHNRFGACLVLDRARLNALIARLVDGPYTADDVRIAVDAYHRHVTTDPYYRDPGRACPASPCGSLAHKQFAAFLMDEKFEKWLQEGRLARAAQMTEKSRRQFAAPPSGRRAELLKRFEALANADRRAVVGQAVHELELEGKPHGTYAQVRDKALEILGRTTRNEVGGEK